MITFDKAELISFPEKVKIETLLSRPSDLSDIQAPLTVQLEPQQFNRVFKLRFLFSGGHVFPPLVHVVSFKAITSSQVRESVILLGSVLGHRTGYHTNRESDITVDLSAEQQQPAGPCTCAEFKYSRICRGDPKRS